ncbi:unnamed protein product [Clonostachys rhizophaga]|uniref:AMP-dependent synthetase/ligase domain-containing protein n=1 Tax=Clonostachys rhizophaga TaxID=160324 RepID=A0A9N9VF45_9HYPO|nr:unnamed protein product [Clonostachys rhizophaga]
MVPQLRTHITNLVEVASKHPDRSALKVPLLSDKGTFTGYETLSFAQFLGDVENSARYWTRELSKKGLKQGDVVGLWLKGLSYLDGLVIWGISRTGFTPQIFSVKLTSGEVIATLLGGADAKAFLVEPSWVDKAKVNVPMIPIVDTRFMDLDHLPLAPVWVPSSDKDIVTIYHSSGSTSGMPKSIPVTVGWLEFCIIKMQELLPQKEETVIAANGTFAHPAIFMVTTGVHASAGSIILPKEMPCSSSEIKLMVKEYGLRSLFMYSSYLADRLRDAHSDPELLRAFQSLEDIMFGGLPLEQEEASWARAKGLKMKEVFASTELGVLMSSVGGNGPDSTLLQPMKGTSYKLLPVNSGNLNNTEVSASEQLLELVVSAESRDCPVPALRNKETGNFHTGDLFVEAKPGLYESRGRNDDWIKMSSALRCDTLAIEQNIMEKCAFDLIDRVVVVGSGRPSPAVLVEPKAEQADPLSLSKEILRRITPFHERRYMHERIDNARYVIILPHGSLSKTAKGSVQRKLVEKTFQTQLDQVYASA